MIKKFNNKNLVELNDLMLSPFYIRLTKEYRELLIKKALAKKKDFKTLAKEIGCDPYTLRHFRDYKEKYIKAEFLQSLLNLLDIPIQDAENYTLSVKRGCSNRDVKINLPIKTTPELALLIAKVCGDGSILSDWRFHYTNNQLNLIEEVTNAVNSSIGQTRYDLQDRKNRKTFEVKFSPVVGFILRLVGAPQGYKLNQEYSIPDWVMEGDDKIKSYFLRGIFDDESTVDPTGKRIFLAIAKTQTYVKSLECFLKQIQKLLSNFSIHTGNITVQQKYNDKIILKIAIYWKSNFENFERFIGFTNITKMENLRKMINNYIDTHKTRDAILKTLREAKNPLTINEVSKLNNLKRDATKFHLYNFLRENKVKKTNGKSAKWTINRYIS